MTAPATARHGHPLRYAAVTSALVLTVCAVLAAVAGAGLASSAAVLSAATGRTVGTVAAATGDAVVVRWAPAGGAARADEIPVAGTPPPAGTRTEVAYAPAAPHRPLVPGAAVLAAADRALTGVALAGTVAALVLGTAAWQLVTRRRAARAPAVTLPVRRVLIRPGLVARSWLETETRPVRWIPVHFDPALLTLPSPTRVRLRGDPRQRRLVAADIGGRLLPPAGPVRSVEPRGRRLDNPARMDATAPGRAAARAGLRHRLVADLPLLVPAPLVAALWTWVDGGGAGTWIATTVLLGALALWWAALRGSDPS